MVQTRGGFSIGPRVLTASMTRPYERQPGDPLYRPLRIFALDPLASRLEGATALVNIPYEPLDPGPEGCLFRVECGAGDGLSELRRLDLEDPKILINQGLAPTTTDPRFHQQMVYAVCSQVYAVFRRALGRDLGWYCAEAGSFRKQLVLRPFVETMRNAYYDRDAGELVFGHFAYEVPVDGRMVHRGYVFTCLSHDIVTHELTHALLDGLRGHFTTPSSPDVLAFHEAFADLVALFMHFSYGAVVEAGIRNSEGDLSASALLLGLAREFGEASGRKGPLRQALALSGDGRPMQLSEAGSEPHERGGVLVAAVFDAFLTIYRRKTDALLRIAGYRPGADAARMPAELQAMLAEKASKLAQQFNTICIRAIDYCPPVDIEFGEFLRAVVTADRDLVADDPFAYREAWIDAFRCRGIFPSGVSDLWEDALVWRPPANPPPPNQDLAFSRLQFEGDPARAAGPLELQRQAEVLGTLVTQPEMMAACGLAAPGDARLEAGGRIEPPVIESIRTTRRIGPDGQVLFDLVAEVTQRRIVHQSDRELSLMGGATLILGPAGEVRYLIAKSVFSTHRFERQRAFIASPEGQRFWVDEGGRVMPRGEIFRLCHETAD